MFAPAVRHPRPIAVAGDDPRSDAGPVRAGRRPTDGPPLPRPRGPRSAALLRALRAGATADLDRLPTAPGPSAGDPLADDDLQLALYCCYELHYRGFAGVADGLEWDPALLAFRAGLERTFLEPLLDRHPGPGLRPAAAAAELRRLATTPAGPSLSAFLADPTSGTRPRIEEFLIHRSAYQLKEADPHTWAMPRLHGPGKAAMVEIQADEYGGGVDGLMHAQLFAGTLRSVGLDRRYGAYLDRLPATTLATVNLVSLLGLHRRWRGALVGHLALFEMTSVGPMGRYATALSRIGAGALGRRFYDVHVTADEHHQVIALDQMVAGLLAEEPDLGGDVVFGAAALTEVERRFSAHLLDAWAAGRPSLRPAVGQTGRPRPT